MSSTYSAVSADITSALPQLVDSAPCNSSSAKKTADCSLREPTACRCMMTLERSMQPEEVLSCLLAVHRASEPALHQQSTASAQAPACGQRCCESPSSWTRNGLSWSSHPATRNGKPKSRMIWRELATTVPELSLRLAILVRRISAGECSFLPTVVCRDWRSPGRPSHPRLNGTRGQPLPETLGTRLHPEVCEWLMGFPVGYTEQLPSRQLEIQIHQECAPSSDAQS